MSINGWNIGILILGYAVTLIVGHFFVGRVVNHLWQRYVPSLERHPELPAIIGALDIILYMSSFLIGAPEFIPIWLAIKVAGEWSPSKSELDRPLYHIFLIGNALNVILSVGMALLLQAFFRP